jgi:hypothetical protein
MSLKLFLEMLSRNKIKSGLGAYGIILGVAILTVTLTVAEIVAIIIKPTPFK